MSLVDGNPKDSTRFDTQGKFLPVRLVIICSSLIMGSFDLCFTLLKFKTVESEVQRILKSTLEPGFGAPNPSQHNRRRALPSLPSPSSDHPPGVPDQAPRTS